MGGGLVLVATSFAWDFVMSRLITYPHEDKHKAPSSAPPRPLSLQDEDAECLHYPFRSSNFIMMRWE
jgi:hypothetical protein